MKTLQTVLAIIDNVLSLPERVKALEAKATANGARLIAHQAMVDRHQRDIENLRKSLAMRALQAIKVAGHPMPLAYVEDYNWAVGIPHGGLYTWETREAMKADCVAMPNPLPDPWFERDGAPYLRATYLQGPAVISANGAKITSDGTDSGRLHMVDRAYLPKGEK